jgi:hypothetical protein
MRLCVVITLKIHGTKESGGHINNKKFDPHESGSSPHILCAVNPLLCYDQVTAGAVRDEKESVASTESCELADE